MKRNGTNLQVAGCVIGAAVPFLLITLQVTTWIRNIPNWDEFDTVLDLLLALDQQPGPLDLARLLFEANNEHRILLSRLLFAASYWIGGGINFAALAVVGNLFLLGATAIAVTSASGQLPRFRLAAMLGATAFSLSHHENFFWSGSSIDHFLVVLTAVFSFRVLIVPGRATLAIACAGGLGATFSLTHGLLVWPIGALLLGSARRWRALTVWGVAGVLVSAGFFSGFHFNPGHPVPGLADLPHLIIFWLALIGAAPALDQVGLAPWWGALLLTAGVILCARGVREQERFAVAVAGWCVAALALIAWGRALLADPWAPLTSRYVILSSFAWALLGWVLLERLLARTSRRNLVLVPVLGVLLAGNFTAYEIHGAAGPTFAQTVECGLGAYRRTGTLAAAQPYLYPDPARADELLRKAEARGLVRLPALPELTLARPTPVRLAECQEVGDAAYFIERFDVGVDSVRVRGWAFRPNTTLRLGDIYVVLRAIDDLYAINPTPLLRPDVARAFQRRDAIFSGFDVRIPRAALPAGHLAVGLGFEVDGASEFTMTALVIDNSAQ